MGLGKVIVEYSGRVAKSLEENEMEARWVEVKKANVAVVALGKRLGV
jgi:hypothetical protein